MNKKTKFNGDDLVKSAKSSASKLPNKIEYFERENHGWGRIIRREINTSNDNYLNHTDESVTYIDGYTDMYDEIRYENVTKTRKFSVVRDQLIASHKNKIAELQKEVDILEASDTFDKYKDIVYKK